MSNTDLQAAACDKLKGWTVIVSGRELYFKRNVMLGDFSVSTEYVKVRLNGTIIYLPDWQFDSDGFPVLPKNF